MGFLIWRSAGDRVIPKMNLKLRRFYLILIIIIIIFVMADIITIL